MMEIFFLKMYINIGTKTNIKRNYIMKNIVYILLLFPCLLLSQTPGQNYVKTTTYKKPYKTISTNPECNVQVNYFDGLGRSAQSVLSKAGGSEEDIITHVDYDMYGRQTKEYLPFATPGNGSVKAAYQTGAIDKILLFYDKSKYEKTPNPYSEKRYENSPLNRVKEQGAPGEAWKLQDKFENYFYFDLLKQVFNENICTSEDPLIGLPRTWIVIEVKNNILTFSMATDLVTQQSWGSSEGCSINVPPIQLFDESGSQNPISIPNLDLGELTDNFGNPTGYRAIIQNGFLQLKTVLPGVSPLPILKAFDTKVSMDLSLYIETQNLHTVKFDYRTNTINEVRRFGVSFVDNNTEKPSLILNGSFAAKQLSKNITKDENWTKTDGLNKTTEEFTDKQGRVILKRTYTDNKKHDTYYVYDKFSNLTYVLPPLASDKVIKDNFTISPAAQNSPWTKIVSVSQKVAADFDEKLKDVPNSDILNVDYFSQYGGRGGFSIIPDENNNIALNLNITTSTPMTLKTGVIAELSTLGSYANKELGRIKGDDYEYIFVIINNKIQVNGSGKLSSINTTLNGYQKLRYSKNYPWTKICETSASTAKEYEEAIKNIENSDILTTYVANSNGASGGVAISLDEFDTLTLSLNINSNVSMSLATGAVFTLDIERSITDRELGSISGENYFYKFIIKDNALYISGSGKLTQAVHFSSQIYKLNSTLDQDAVKGLCYIYHYDKRNRVIEKYIPDNGTTYMVYDKLDRVVLSQDENLRRKKSPESNWLFTKYDAYGRVVYSGDCRNPNDREVIQSYYDGVTTALDEKRSSTPFISGGLNIYYSNDFYPKGNDFMERDRNVTVVNYYDDYNFDTKTQVIGGIPPGHPNEPYTNNLKGLATGGHVRILGTDDWITNLIRYDEKARPVLNWSHNSYLSSWQLVTSNLDFVGNVISSSTQHKFGNDPEITTYDFYTYDNMSRMLDHSQSINSKYMLIAWNQYDELGKLKEKKVGGKIDYITTSPTYATHKSYQTIDYTYNIRNWLKSINGALFTFGIKYNDNGNLSLYNGNISQTNWKTSGNNTYKLYNYQYDGLNRLKNADFTGGSLKYNEGDITYDKNGNIISLTRSGLKTDSTNGIIDDLSYIYKPYSNQLLKVTDNANDAAGFDNGGSGSNNDYDYDAAGNMKKDLNKGIGKVLATEITYNHLNLPLKVAYEPNKYVEYLYSATGEKIQKTVNDLGAITTTQYANGYIYKNGVFEYFSHPEGYVRKETNGNFTYVYQYKDHLGNVRLSYADTNGDGVIADSNFNEGFENGVSNWGGIGSNTQLELDNTIFRSGKYSAKITSPGPDGRISKCGVWMDINNSQDTYYTYTVYIKSNKPNAEIVLFMKTAEETGFYTSLDSYAYHGYMTQWTKLEKTVLVPANIKKLSLRLDTNSDGTVWFDDVSIRRADGQTEIIEETDYYPFGMQHKDLNDIVMSSNLGQKIKYNGKELQDELQLGLYDFGARNYSPELGRWMNIDPMAEQGRRWSPYAYAFDNPVYFIDPDGMWPWPSWSQVKSFASGVGNGAVGYARNIKNTISNIPSTLKNAASSPKAAAAFVANNHPQVLVYKAIASNFTTPANIVKSAVQGNAQAAGEAYGGHLAAGAVAWATAGMGKGGGKAAVGENNTMKSLTADVQAAASDLKSAGRSPATVVGAELNGQTAIGTSGAPPGTIAPQLEAAAAELGGVGTKTASGNTVGCCGEFHAGNELLLKNPSATPTSVNFTDAIRPRTGEVVPPCENCTSIFGL